MRRVLVPISALVVASLGPLALGLPAAVAQESTPGAAPAGTGAIEVMLRDVDGRDVGVATVGEAADGWVSIDVVAEGLPPGEHGIHIHETGVCDPAGDQPFATAGKHYNPTGAKHGGPPAGAEGTPPATDAMATPGATMGHAGDLGNILVDEGGRVRQVVMTDRLRRSELSDADGSALVIHADPDDLTTDPSGNSGGRIVCGVIAPSHAGGTPTPATPAP